MVAQEAIDKECVRIVALTDPHLSAHKPASFKVDYWPLIKETIRRVLRHAKELEADLVLWGGDIFHLKAPQRSPLWFMAEVIELFREHGLTHVGIAGNHDLKFGSLAGLKGQPLEVLIKAGAYHLLDEEPWAVTAEDVVVEVQGSSYHHAHADRTRDLRKLNPEATLIAAGHFWFGPQTGTFFSEPVYGPDYLGKGEPDIYFIGHHHEDQGAREIDGKWYISPGSIGKTGSHKHDMDRRPAAVLIEISKGRRWVQILRPKFPSAEEVFDLEVRDRVAKEEEAMTHFVNVLGTSKLEGVEPGDMLEEMKTTAAVKEKAKEYLERAEE